MEPKKSAKIIDKTLLYLRFVNMHPNLQRKLAGGWIHLTKSIESNRNDNVNFKF